jgi:hypothetical protein
MIFRIGKQWNETVWVNVGGRTIGTKKYVQMTIHHGVYTETEIIIILAVVISLLYMFYISFYTLRRKK